MTIDRLFRFLFWFAWRDLFERRARRTTVVILLTLSALTAFTLVVYGLAMGYERVRLERLMRDPQALCLVAGDLPLGRKITPGLLEELRRKIPAALSSPKGLVGCHAYYEKELDWVVGGGDGPEHLMNLTGRTLAPADPLLASYPLESGEPLGDSRPEGVIVTPGMLRLLQLPTSPPPPTLRIRSATGKLIEVPVAGVTRDSLPLGHYYVLREDYELRLLMEDPKVAVANVRTGAVPASWPKPDTLPAVVRRALDEYDILPPLVDEVGGKTVWLLRSSEAPPPLRSTWLAYVRNIGKLMEEKGFAAAPDFTTLHAPEVGQRPPSRQGYDMATIYVRDFHDLQPAARAIQSTGLLVNEDVIRQIEGIARSSRNALLLLTVVVAVVVLLSFGNIYIIQELRTQQKLQEFGLLRAIGMNDRLLRRLYLAEGAVLWVLASLVGVTLGLLAGNLVTRWVIDDPAERSSAFYCSARVVAALLATSGLVCWFSVLLATNSARRTSPIETLNRH